MKNNWTERRIGDFSKRIKRINTPGEDLPPLSVTKHSGVLLQADKFKKRIATDPRKYFIVHHGEFIFDPMSLYYGSVGRFLKTERGLASPDYVVFSMDQTVDPTYLNYLLRSPFMIAKYEVLAEGGNQVGKRRRVYWSVFENINVILPSLGEQKKIAVILNSVEDAIEAAQAVIDQLQVVKKAMMAELLTRGLPRRHTRFKQTEIGEIPETWDVVSLGSLATFVTSGSRGWAEFYAEEGALFLRSQNVRAGYVDLSDQAFVRPPNGAECVRTRLICGDILVTITGNSVGNVAVAPDGIGEAYVSQHVGLVRLHDPSLSSFCALYLSPGSPGNEQVHLAQYGQSKPGLNLSNLRNFRVALPPRAELQSIRTTFEAVQSRIEAEKATLISLNTVKSALMSVLLTGEVRVTPDP